MIKKIIVTTFLAGMLVAPMYAGPKMGVAMTAAGTTAALAGSCITAIALNPDARQILLPSIYAACCNYQGLALAASMGGAFLAIGGLMHTLISSPGFLGKMRGLLASAGAVGTGAFGSGAIISGFVHNAHNASLLNQAKDYTWASVNGGQDGIQLMSRLNQFTSLGCVGASIIATVALGLSLLIAPSCAKAETANS